MDTVIEGGAILERDLMPEPLAAPAAGAIALHGAILAALILR